MGEAGHTGRLLSTARLGAFAKGGAVPRGHRQGPAPGLRRRDGSVRDVAARGRRWRTVHGRNRARITSTVTSADLARVLLTLPWACRCPHPTSPPEPPAPSRRRGRRPHAVGSAPTLSESTRAHFGWTLRTLVSEARLRACLPGLSPFIWPTAFSPTASRCRTNR